MFRNQYDGDVTIWSPQGRLHQVEYAMEAVKQGSATVGMRSDTHAVLVARKRAANDLCSHQKKIINVDDHIAVSIAGLLSDGRILARYLQEQCAAYKWDHKENMPLAIIEDRLTLKMQRNTQGYGRRPFGVGMLIAGYDEHGAHLYRSDPNAEVTECYAMSIGGRSQSARTYLEKHLAEFAASTLDQLIQHALLALRDTIPAEEDLTAKNTSIAFVGVGQQVTTLEDEETAPYLSRIADIARSRLPGGAVGAGADIRMEDEPDPQPDPNAEPQPQLHDAVPLPYPDRPDEPE